MSDYKPKTLSQHIEQLDKMWESIMKENNCTLEEAQGLYYFGVGVCSGAMNNVHLKEAIGFTCEELELMKSFQ